MSSPNLKAEERIAKFKRNVEALNKQFLEWVTSQIGAQPDRLLTNGITDYTRHAAKLRLEYQDVINSNVEGTYYVFFTLYYKHTLLVHSHSHTLTYPPPPPPPPPPTNCRRQRQRIRVTQWPPPHHLHPPPTIPDAPLPHQDPPLHSTWGGMAQCGTGKCRRPFDPERMATSPCPGQTHA